MPKDNAQEICDRLFTTFLGPLVVGGPMRPGKPIGGKQALAIGPMRPPSDADLLSRTELGRVRTARKIAPIDTFEGAPDEHEWALAATLHDLVQSTHPGFDAAFRRSGPKRILEVIDKTLERIPPPASVGSALSRHTWFANMFELARTDVDLRWWTGSQRFLGTEPPARLTAWPEIRRVQETRTPHPLMDLPSSGSAVDLARFAGIVEQFLRKNPLTDLATIDRAVPAFVWTHESLALAATHAGRTILSRAMALRPEGAVDNALGRATRNLFLARAPRALFVAIDILRDRALRAAAAQLGKNRPEGKGEPDPLTLEQNDAAFALGAGALAASQWIAQTGGGFNESERRAMLLVLAPAASSTAAREVQAFLSQ